MNTEELVKLWSFLHDRLHEIYKKLRETGGREEYHARLDAEASKLCDEVSARFVRQQVPVMGEAVAFGSGDKIVDVGTYNSTPAVFVMPAPVAGVVGDRTGDIYPRDSLIAGEFVLTFPTANQAQAVADALCNTTSITQAELERLRECEAALLALKEDCQTSNDCGYGTLGVGHVLRTIDAATQERQP